MPRYHFKIHDGESRPDSDGISLPDRDVVWEEAIRTYAEMLKEMNGELRKGTELKMDVTDAGGHPVFTLRFSAVEHAGKPKLTVAPLRQPPESS